MKKETAMGGVRAGGGGGGGGGRELNVELQWIPFLGGEGRGGTRMRRGDGLPGIVVIW